VPDESLRGALSLVAGNKKAYPGGYCPDHCPIERPNAKALGYPEATTTNQRNSLNCGAGLQRLDWVSTFNLSGALRMPLSGEAIRTMNYVDDISVTLRRILAVLPSLTEDERQRVSDHIKSAEPSYESVISAVASKK
jgi:hypothetical protein